MFFCAKWAEGGDQRLWHVPFKFLRLPANNLFQMIMLAP